MESTGVAVFQHLAIQIMWVVIFVFAISLITLFLGLGFHKNHIIRYALKKTNLFTFYTNEISLVCSGEIASLTQPNHVIEAICLATAYTCYLFQSATDVIKIQILIEKSEAITLLKKELYSKDWGRRYQVLNAFADFHLPSSCDYLIDFSEKENNVRVFGNCLLACALSICKPAQFKAFSILINAKWLLSASYGEGVLRIALRSLIIKCPKDAYDIMNDCLNSDNLNVQYKAALINAIGKEQFQPMKSALSSFARKSLEQIIKLSTMRALSNLSACDDLILISMDSANPIEQLVAIRSSIHCGVSVAEKVAHHLSSPYFDVRYAAAKTLLQFPENGHALLAEASKQHTDRFARDMANFALSLE